MKIREGLARDGFNILATHEELEILSAGTMLRTSHHCSPGGGRRGKGKRSMTFLERTRKGHCQSDEHWNCHNGSVGETLRDGVERIWDFPSA